MVRGMAYSPRVMDTQVDTGFGEPQRRQTRSEDGFQLRAPRVKGRVLGYVLEICIGAKQFCSDVQTPLGDDTVDRSTSGDPPASRRTE